MRKSIDDVRTDGWTTPVVKLLSQLKNKNYSREQKSSGLRIKRTLVISNIKSISKTCFYMFCNNLKQILSIPKLIPLISRFQEQVK